jgi:hypothetical protein
LIKLAFNGHPEGKGLNVKKLLDDPTGDLLSVARIMEKGIDGKYLEPETGRKVLDLSALTGLTWAFDGPFGFAYAARLN